MVNYSALPDRDLDALAFDGTLDRVLTNTLPVYPPLTPATRPTMKPATTRSRVPTLKTMDRWMDAGVTRATDGCRVEPDGRCPHGKPSWLVRLGYI